MIGIIGGGISGLAVAHHLAARDVPFVLLEARPDPGGVMRTVTSGHPDEPDYPLDTGPQRTRLTRDVRELVVAAGLEGEVVEAREGPLMVYRNGRLRRVPLSLGEALTTDLLSWPGRARVLLEPLLPGPREDETVEAFFTRSFGREAYRAMIGPYYGGLYGSDPARMYVRHGLRTTLDHFGVRGSLLLALVRRGLRARQAVPTVSFRGGMQALPLGLTARYRDHMQTATAVRSLRRNPSGGWLIEPEAGDAMPVDRVVLALSAPEAAGVLEEAAPEAARRIGMLRYNHLAVVHMLALGGGVELRGAGYQVAFGEDMVTRGVTWNGALFDRDGLCAAYLGGMRNPEVLEWDEDRVAATAAAELTRATGHRVRVLRVSRTWIPAWDETWDALDGLELPERFHLCTNWHARPGIPGRAAEARRVAAEVAAAGAATAAGTENRGSHGGLPPLPPRRTGQERFRP